VVTINSRGMFHGRDMDPSRLGPGTTFSNYRIDCGHLEMGKGEHGRRILEILAAEMRSLLKTEAPVSGVAAARGQVP